MSREHTLFDGRVVLTMHNLSIKSDFKARQIMEQLKDDPMAKEYPQALRTFASLIACSDEIKFKLDDCANVGLEAWQRCWENRDDYAKAWDAFTETDPETRSMWVSISDAEDKAVFNPITAPPDLLTDAERNENSPKEKPSKRDS